VSDLDSITVSSPSQSSKVLGPGAAAERRARGQQSDQPLLGITANISSASTLEWFLDVTSRRVLLYTLQRQAAKLLPAERVSYCCHRMVNPDGVVSVRHDPGRKSASYKGVMTCGSIWSCAVCASKISERRRLEVEEAIEGWSKLGGSFLFATFTLQHTKNDKLSDLLDCLRVASDRFHNGRVARRLRDRFEIAAKITALEVTYGVNGWHVHLHVLYFIRAALTVNFGVVQDFENQGSQRWQYVLSREGRFSDLRHGFRVQFGDQAISGYMTKVSGSWGTSHELAKSVVKKGKRGNRSPFGLLLDSYLGDTEAGRLFVEYYNVFKGRNHLTWSHHLRSILGLGQVKSDEALAKDDKGGSDLAFLERVAWRAVLANDIRGELLDVASQGDFTALKAFLLDFGISEGVFDPVDFEQ